MRVSRVPFFFARRSDDLLNFFSSILPARVGCLNGSLWYRERGKDGLQCRDVLLIQAVTEEA